eukprot:684698-Prymnesium_polylepis.1
MAVCGFSTAARRLRHLVRHDLPERRRPPHARLGLCASRPALRPPPQRPRLRRHPPGDLRAVPARPPGEWPARPARAVAAWRWNASVSLEAWRRLLAPS